MGIDLDVSLRRGDVKALKKELKLDYPKRYLRGVRLVVHKMSYKVREELKEKASTYVSRGDNVWVVGKVRKKPKNSTKRVVYPEYIKHKGGRIAAVVLRGSVSRTTRDGQNRGMVRGKKKTLHSGIAKQKRPSFESMIKKALDKVSAEIDQESKKDRMT